jgi:hypothetical protein
MLLPKMTRLFFILVLSASFHLSNASSYIGTLTDTIPSGKMAYKFNRIDFLENYGKDDTSRALINFFFTKRNRAITLTLIGGGGSVIADIAFNSFLNSVSLATLGDLILGYILLNLAVDVAFTLLVIGIIRWLVYSRRKLLSILKNYSNGKGIPRNILKSRSFKKQLLFEHESHR